MSLIWNGFTYLVVCFDVVYQSFSLIKPAIGMGGYLCLMPNGIVNQRKIVWNEAVRK